MPIQTVLSPAEKKQRMRYQVNLKMDPDKDKDIIEVLNRVNKKQTFIKTCIRYFNKTWIRYFDKTWKDII